MELKYITKRQIFLISAALLGIVCIALFGVNQNKQQARERQLNPRERQQQNSLQPHPGTITEKNLFDHTESSIPAEQFSAGDQFVYTKGWKETQNPDDADSVLPIVAREITPLSKTGEPTSREKAATLHIKEYGSSGLLRERTINAPTNTMLPPPEIIDGRE